MPCKGIALQVKGNTKALPSPSDILNPDILNPDSLNTLSDDSVYVSSDDDTPEPTPKTEKPKEAIPYREIVEHYHRLCPSLAKCKSLNTTRRIAIRMRWSDLDRDFSKLDEFLTKVERSDFITGRNGAWRGTRGIDWITKESNFLKIQEGNYDNGGNNADPRGNITAATAKYADFIEADKRQVMPWENTG